MIGIKVLDYTELPGLRHIKLSDFSGEDFYHTILNESFYLALDQKEKIQINLDDTAGYPPSFLDEAIGNLVYDFSLQIVKDNVEYISLQEPDLIESLENETYPKWEKRRLKGEKPKKTLKKGHKPWVRIVDGEFISKEFIQPSL